MKGNQLKKKLIVFGAKSALFVINVTTALYKLLFSKRTLLFVTNQKIRSVTFGPVAQGCILLFTIWIADMFIQSLRYDQVVNAKSEEISHLHSMSAYFQEEFENTNEKLKKLNEYLNVLTGSSHNVKAIEENKAQPKNLDEDALSRKDKHTLKEIKTSKQQLSDIHSVIEERTKRLESAISITGLNVKRAAPKEPKPTKEISLNKKKDLSKGQGGPLDDEANSEIDKALALQVLSNEDLFEMRLEKARFINEVDHLIILEKLVNSIPLSRPMKNYYVSSGFGRRVDPITGRRAEHHGLDFVGVTHEKIISPSRGKVVLAGKFSGYGNAVVIDHGYGITTRYGHLFSVKVAPGQIVKKGDVIALQGNTGRSTGPHLHYEVRYKNIPLNPKKFLEAGDFLAGKKAINYADS
ncbi:MAG: peptidoglycan DD-metalloendopeptidase family protein [Proteobacteria bacterium]|nr:peptidoglycan DD-metalloendopeptidase family protein [Pseudomonadota bacterium]